MSTVKVVLSEDEYKKAASIAIAQGRATGRNPGIAGVLRAALRPYISKNYRAELDKNLADAVDRKDIDPGSSDQ